MGIAYEKAFHQFAIDSNCLPNYLDSPWFEYWDRLPVRHYCQPDSLSFDLDTGILWIVEVKLKHTSSAFYQTTQHYAPVVRRACGPGWELGFLEVCRYLDPHTPFPVEYHTAQDWGDLRPGRFNVIQWQ